MTENDWLKSEDPSAMLASADPAGMLDFIKGRASDRQLRLFACATARLHIAQYNATPALRSVEVAERAVELGQPDHNYDDRPNRLVNQHWAVCRSREAAELMARNHRHAATAALLRDVVGNPFRPVTLPESITGEDTVRSLALAAYHERMPDGQFDSARLAVLSDALEEAGCVTSEPCQFCGGKGFHEIGFVKCDAFGIHDSRQKVGCVACKTSGRKSHPLVKHLRSPGPHYRGCWAVDLILGKS